MPPAVGTSGPEACDLLRTTGQKPDGWQEDSVADILAEGEDGRWAARRTYQVVPRQNGKGGCIEPIELYGLYVLHETILHSAHLFDTSREAFMRVRALIEGTPDLSRRVKRINEAHGKEGIELLDRPAVFTGDGMLVHRSIPGGQLRFHARTKGGGRGKSPQRLVLDEGFALTREQMAALLPSISAQDDPHVNVFSTPPPVGDPAVVLMAARRSVLDRIAARLPAEVAWLEWGVERGVDVTQPAAWAQANPAYGIRISERTCRDELDALGLEEFSVERCGMWPLMGDAQWTVIPEADWTAADDPTTARAAGARPALAVDMAPDRSWAAILVAWYRPDGLRQVAVNDLREGTGWVVDRAHELRRRHNPCVWVVDRASPATSLIPDLERDTGPDGAPLIEVVRMSTPDGVAAAGMVWDGICGVPTPGSPSPRTLRHSGQQRLDDAVAAAVRRPPDDKAWCWDRARPWAWLLIGATGAVWGLATRGHHTSVAPATVQTAPAGDDRGLWRPSERLNL